MKAFKFVSHCMAAYFLAVLAVRLIVESSTTLNLMAADGSVKDGSVFFSLIIGYASYFMFRESGKFV